MRSVVLNRVHVAQHQLLSALFSHVFLLCLRSRKSHSQILKAIGGMKAAIDHEQSMDAVEVSEGGDFLKVDSEKIRTKFYNKLEMNGVKVSKIRQEVAVENMARVIKRIKMEYDMNAVDYFKIISHNQKEISMLWDVLLYMFGDLVEKDSGGGYTNKSSAKEIAKLSRPTVR